MAHRTRTELEAVLADVAASPRDHGTVDMIVLRPGVDQRATPDEAVCTVEGGVLGDNWLERGSRYTENGRAQPEAQVTMTNRRWLEVIAGGRERWPLAGDQLVVDLDLSDDALAAGDRLRVGGVVFEVTAKPHNGCVKYRDRFGADALKVASSPAGRRLHLRGIYLRVVEPGTVRVGDTITRVPLGLSAV